MKKFKLKNVTHAVVKHIGDRFNKYDLFIALGLFGATLFDYFEYEGTASFFLGVLVYGLIGMITKNLRPDVTILVADRKISVVSENDDT